MCFDNCNPITVIIFLCPEPKVTLIISFEFLMPFLMPWKQIRKLHKGQELKRLIIHSLLDQSLLIFVLQGFLWYGICSCIIFLLHCRYFWTNGIYIKFGQIQKVIVQRKTLVL